ncbi:MAG: glycogen/starch synthase, partial [Candidatus Omnitrophica bacterium]|nr:glycogen/starch synthase [Candidatus Omnitrophota bacterium]
QLKQPITTLLANEAFPCLNIVFAAAEMTGVVPYAGLGDVIEGLSLALAGLGQNVSVVLPRFEMMEQGEETEQILHIPFGDATKNYEVGTLRYHDLVRVFIIRGDFGPIYQSTPEQQFEEAVILSRAPFQLTLAPQILVSNDWQRALVPLYLGEYRIQDASLAGTAVIQILHNLGYKGEIPHAWWALARLQESYNEFVHFGQLLLLKAALLRAHRLVPVSKRNRQEIVWNEKGLAFGFEEIFSARAQEIFGITNRIDCQAWNPLIDTTLAARYDKEGFVAARLANAQALRQRIGLSIPAADQDAPLLGMVTRAVEQKGVHLVAESLTRLLGSTDAQFIFNGNADMGRDYPRNFIEQLRILKAQYPGRVAIISPFDKDLSRLMYGACLLLLYPSLYDPCNVDVMKAIRYGVLPLGRSTGGIDEHIFNYDPHAHAEEVTGFKFHDYTAEALTGTIFWALRVLANFDLRNRLQQNNILTDFSWERDSVYEYLALMLSLLDDAVIARAQGVNLSQHAVSSSPLANNSYGAVVKGLTSSSPVTLASIREARQVYQYIGISIGGNKLAVSLNDGVNNILDYLYVQWRQAFPDWAKKKKSVDRQDSEDVMAVVVAQIRALLERNGVSLNAIRLISANLAGPVDGDAGIYGSDFPVTNLPFDQYPFRQRLGDLMRTADSQFRVVVHMCNDGEGALKGETYSPRGLLADFENGGIVIIGGGINIAVKKDGNVYFGPEGRAEIKEVGHSLFQHSAHYRWAGHYTLGGHPIERGNTSKAIIRRSGQIGEEYVRLRQMYGWEKAEQVFLQDHPGYPFIAWGKGERDMEDRLSGPSIARRFRKEKLPFTERTVTQEALSGNQQAVASIQSIAVEIGKALAAFMAHYQDKEFVRHLVLVSGINENMGKEVYANRRDEQAGLDIYIKFIRQSTFFELTRYFYVSRRQAADMVSGIVRSQLTFERELVSYQPSDEDVLAPASSSPLASNSYGAVVAMRLKVTNGIRSLLQSRLSEGVRRRLTSLQVGKEIRQIYAHDALLLHNILQLHRIEEFLRRRSQSVSARSLLPLSIMIWVDIKVTGGQIVPPDFSKLTTSSLSQIPGERDLWFAPKPLILGEPGTNYVPLLVRLIDPESLQVIQFSGYPEVPHVLQAEMKLTAYMQANSHATSSSPMETIENDLEALAKRYGTKPSNISSWMAQYGLTLDEVRILLEARESLVVSIRDRIPLEPRSHEVHISMERLVSWYLSADRNEDVLTEMIHILFGLSGSRVISASLKDALQSYRIMDEITRLYASGADLQLIHDRLLYQEDELVAGFELDHIGREILDGEKADDADFASSSPVSYPRTASRESNGDVSIFLGRDTRFVLGRGENRNVPMTSSSPLVFPNAQNSLTVSSIKDAFGIRAGPATAVSSPIAQLLQPRIVLVESEPRDVSDVMIYVRWLAMISGAAVMIVVALGLYAISLHTPLPFSAFNVNILLFGFISSLIINFLSLKKGYTDEDSFDSFSEISALGLNSFSTPLSYILSAKILYPIVQFLPPISFTVGILVNSSLIKSFSVFAWGFLGILAVADFVFAGKRFRHNSFTRKRSIKYYTFICAPLAEERFLSMPVEPSPKGTASSVVSARLNTEAELIAREIESLLQRGALSADDLTRGPGFAELHARLHRLYTGVFLETGDVPIDMLQLLAILYSPGIGRVIRVVLEMINGGQEEEAKKFVCDYFHIKRADLDADPDVFIWMPEGISADGIKAVVFSDSSSNLGFGDTHWLTMVFTAMGKAMLITHLAHVPTAICLVKDKKPEKLEKALWLASSVFTNACLMLEDIHARKSFSLWQEANRVSALHDLNRIYWHDDATGTAMNVALHSIMRLIKVGKKLG